MGFLSGLLGAVGAVTEVLGGIKGLTRKEKKAPTPADNIMSQAQGAREAAEKYGFNPLTLLQYGQTGGSLGAGGGGAPPLASVDLLTSGLRGLDDIASGDQARRRQADQLELDLAKVRLDQARSGVYQTSPGMPGSVAQVQPQASHGVGSGPSPLGRRSAVVSQSNVVSASPAAVTAASRKDNPNAQHPLRPSLGNVSLPDPTLDRGAGLYVAGNRWEGAPGWSSGEIFEQEYGDTFVGEAYSVGKAVADTLHNVQRPDGAEQWYREMTNPGAERPAGRPMFLSAKSAQAKREEEEARKRLRAIAPVPPSTAGLYEMMRPNYFY